MKRTVLWFELRGTPQFVSCRIGGPFGWNAFEGAMKAAIAVKAVAAWCERTI
jgi:hypothetical protein